MSAMLLGSRSWMVLAHGHKVLYLVFISNIFSSIYKPLKCIHRLSVLMLDILFSVLL